MGILMLCRTCQESFPAAEATADRLEECPKCRAAGGEAEAGFDRDAAFTPERVAAAFQGAIPLRGLPWSYRFWVLIVACVMVTLPLIYLAIVASACYVMYWHATHNYVVFQTMKSGKGALMAYVGPLVILGVLVFFLAKPLFARRRQEFRSRSLERDKEPALFALVDGICKAVGAPKPVRIDVDCDVNASAGPESGLFSLLRRRLVLTIGLPLVAAFNAEQFAGVLAHEFGHFAQSTGMKLTYLIRSINGWFARVVYERDEWDESLEQWASVGNVYTIVLGNLARLVVWATRRILWVLMYLGHAVSCGMLRQMEFDADRCEALLGGSATSESTTRRLRVAHLARSGAMADVSESWKEGRLPDDLPRLIEANIGQIPEAGVKAINDMLALEKTKVFDTHPADKDRIAAVLAIRAPGVFHLDGPATALFQDFDALSREVTVDHYRGLLGEAFTPEQLQPYREVVVGVENLQESQKSMGRVYLGRPHILRPVPLPPELPASAVDPGEVKHELERIRGEQQAARTEHDAMLEPHDASHQKLFKAEAARVLLEAGFKVKAVDYELPSATAEAARAVVDATGREISDRSLTLDRFDGLCARRMTLALSLLSVDDATQGLDHSEELRAEVQSLYPVASELGRRVWPAFTALVRARSELLTILGNYEGHEKNEKLHKAIFQAAGVVHGWIVELKAALGEDLPYPFDHAKKGITLTEFALSDVPEDNDIGALLAVSEQAIDRLGSIYFRLLSRLAVAVEKVEAVLGLPVLAIGEESEDNPCADEIVSAESRIAP